MNVNFEICRISDPYVNFKVEITNPANLELSIYNVRGQKVGLTWIGYKGEGTHQVIVNTTNLPSGMYFAQITGGGISEIEKFVLVR